MSKNQKSKNYAITKLYKILDYNSKKDISPKNEKYLGSLSQRLKEISGEEISSIKRIDIESKEEGVDALKPKVIVHAREIKNETVTPKLKIEEKRKIEFEDEEVFEIKKIKIKEPEFIEVKPKIRPKEEIIDIKDLKAEEKKISAWESVEVQKKEETLEEFPEMESISQEEVKKSEDIVKLKEEKKEFKDSFNYCPECGNKIDISVEFCPNCGTEITSEPVISFIPIKKVEKEYKPSEWEKIEVEKPKEEIKPLIEKEEKILVFNDLKSIDEETSVLLYDNGITTIDLLKKSTIKDLTKIKGIKKKTVKKIKKELDKKISELEKVEYIEVEEFEEDEFKEEQLPLDKKIEEETEDWSSPDQLTSETSVWEPIEEESKEKEEEESPVFEEITQEKEIEKPIIDNESKIEIFNGIKSIDSKTAVLLFDNGYTSVDSLIKTPLKDLTKIKGIKRKIARKIKKEIDKAKQAPIVLPFEEAEETKKTDNFLKIEEELGTAKQDLKTITKDLNKKEKNIKKLQEELEQKIKELESKKTELYNRDEEIKLLQNELEQTKKELETENLESNKKQKETDQLQKQLEEKTIDIESKNNELNNKNEEITQLQDQLEQTKKELETENLQLNKKDEEIEKLKKDLQTKEIESDEKQQVITNLKSELTERQKEIELRDKEIKINAFKDINSIDDETAVMLFDNGITSIDALNSISQKDLIKIKGLKRKTAKIIKKELEKKYYIESPKESKTELEKKPFKYKAEKVITKEPKKEEDKRKTEYPGDENNITKQEAIEIDRKIADEFSITVTDNDIFKGVNSIDEKTSKLLMDNGISTIDALKNASVRDLTKIHGIKRKKARQIKKEIRNLTEKVIDIETKQSFEQVEESTDDEEEAEWEYYDEHLISDSTMKEYKGFKHGDYTLYQKEILTKSGKKRIVRFFSKSEPEEGQAIELPEGYEVKKNKKTGIPFLRKKK